MPRPPASSEFKAFEQAVARCRSTLQGAADEALAMPEVLRQALASARSSEVHGRARTILCALASEAEQGVEALHRLVTEVDRQREEWIAEHRYSKEGLAALRRRVKSALDADPRSGARTWLQALLDAADAGEEAAAARIAAFSLEWPEKLRTGAEELREAFAPWRHDGALPGLPAIERLAAGRLTGWRGGGAKSVVTADLRSRAHRLAAWTVLRGPGNTDKARKHMDAALELSASRGRMHAERAALHLFAGDFSRAATDAQRSIELAPRDPSGYLALGIWADLTGKFSGADELYRRGLRLMPIADVAQLHRRTSLVDPPGRLLMAAAAVLLEANRTERALQLVREALLCGVRGWEAHPEAELYVIRRQAFERLNRPGDRARAAKTAVTAGRLWILNGDIDRAIEELEHALALDAGGEAAWLLADALLTKSYPLGATVPDQALVARARATWDEGVGLAQHPRGAASWAYVTRAVISDLESQQPGADRRRGLFEAVMYVEKALVHNHTDAQRFGYLAQFLRYLGFELLAFEAVDAGWRLAAVDRRVLAERLPLLVNRRDFQEAEAVAERLVAIYGEDPWVSAVRAWLALHYRRRWKRALELLELPIAQGGDKAWYHEMAALAHVGLRRLDEAREAYGRVLDVVPLDGNTKCRLSRAALALGKKRIAKEWLEKATEDATTPVSSCLVTAALVAFADQEPDWAVQLFAKAIRLARSAGEIDDLFFETTLSMRAVLDGDSAPALERRLRDETKAAVKEQKASLEEHPPTASDELEPLVKGLPSGPLDIEGTALLAVAARRDAAARDTQRARARYEQLRGSQFEPEASLALQEKSTRERSGNRAAAAVS